MVLALICSQVELEEELSRTLLWRHGVDRHVAKRLEEAQMMAVAARPDIIVVDRDLPRADRLVEILRQDPATRRLSIVVVARGDFAPGEVELLEGGANAILRLPAGPEWDERLVRLIDVPVRKEARFPVYFRVDALSATVPEAVLATAMNLSVRGMLVETHAALRVGDDLELRFRLPDKEDLAEVRGRVVRQASTTQFGIEFEPMDDVTAERINRFLDSVKET